MSQLSDLLNARNPDGLSAREVGRRVEKLGYSMSPATATALFGGRHAKRPDDSTLEGLSRVLPVSLEELRAAAGLPPAPGEPWEPPEVARYLTQDERDALDQLIRAITKSSRSHNGPGTGETAANLTQLPRRDPAPPPIDHLAADAQDGPTVQEADEDIRRQDEAGEEDQDEEG